MLVPDPGSIYNVVDDDPISRAEATSHAQALLKVMGSEHIIDPMLYLPLPSERETRESTSVRRRMESKRVRNEKIKHRLGVALAFPSVEAGLQAILQGDIRPFIQHPEQNQTVSEIG